MAGKQDFNLNLKGLEKGFKRVWQQVPTIAGAKARTFFVQNFRRQGWPEGGRLNKWDKRKGGKNPSRAVLVESGRLRNDIRVLAKNSKFVQIGTTLPYAQAHNEGAVITGQARVGAFTRKAHKRKAHTRSIGGRRQRVKAQQVPATRVKAHTRKMNTRLPKRQFIGESPDVIKSVEREIFRALDEVIQSI